jgi:hypothetical protein
MGRKKLLTNKVIKSNSTPATTTYRNKTYKFHSKKYEFVTAVHEAEYLRDQGYNAIVVAIEKNGERTPTIYKRGKRKLSKK